MLGGGGAGLVGAAAVVNCGLVPLVVLFNTGLEIAVTYYKVIPLLWATIAAFLHTSVTAFFYTSVTACFISTTASYTSITDRMFYFYDNNSMTVYFYD